MRSANDRPRPARLPLRQHVRIIRAVCTLAIYFQTSADFPVLVAANRDEFYSRPATSPAALATDPWIVAGEDRVAHGTWLGVNARGVVAGLLNRRTGQPIDPRRRSRGLLCLETLHEASVDAATTRVCADSGRRYNPFNLLIASRHAACVVGNVSGTMLRTALTPGLHVLTNLEVDDFECPRIAKSYGLFEACTSLLTRRTFDEFLNRLREILSDHSTPLDPRSNGPPNNLCVHTPQYGTRSSSVLAYAASADRFRMWHADGPPCQTAYTEITLPAPQPAAAETAGQV